MLASERGEPAQAFVGRHRRLTATTPAARHRDLVVTCEPSLTFTMGLARLVFCLLVACSLGFQLPAPVPASRGVRLARPTMQVIRRHRFRRRGHRSHHHPVHHHNHQLTRKIPTQFGDGGPKLTRDSEPEEFFSTNMDSMSDADKLKNPVVIGGVAILVLPFIVGLVVLATGK